MFTNFSPGQRWLDTSGKPIQAHGGSILFHEDTFYWYGENKENTYVETGLWHQGVRCYSSKDLYNWNDEGIILKSVDDDRRNPLHPNRIMDRPHILYHKQNKQFVMWVKFAGTDDDPEDWSTQYMGIAVSDKITGPFKVLHTVKPLGMNTGDFDLYCDPADGKGYIIFGRVHTEIVIADLTEDYFNVNGFYSAHFPRSGPPDGREAPALFKRDHRFYLMTSGTTGYQSNPSEVATAQLIHGPWTELGDACREDRQRNSFDSQFSSVFQHPFKKDLYIALGDRWMDGAPKEKVEGPKWNGALANYTWLPIRFEGDRPFVEWRDEWSVEEYEDKPEEIPWWAKPIGA
jgi:beta-xylosidase